MKEEKKVIIPLTGGLGNQLFQFSAALSQAKKRNIICEISMGKPRTNNSGDPQIFEFQFPGHDFSKSLSSNSKFFSKLFGFNLRGGIYSKKFENLVAIKGIIFSLSQIIFSIHLRMPVRLVVNKGVGYSELNAPKNNCLMIGYFQSYIWPSTPETQIYLREMRLQNPSNEVFHYQNLSRVEAPLVVHVRLGDYKSESSFGILSDKYYAEAITNLWASSKYNKIWLFSDEPKKAMNKIPQDLRKQVRVMPEIQNSASQTLEVMRFGHGYVIGNSTYSWWAAFLSYSVTPDIVAPDPWFIGMDSPHRLIPDNWTLRRGFL